MIRLDTKVLIYASDEQSEYCTRARNIIAERVSEEGSSANAVSLAEICVGEVNSQYVADRIRSSGSVHFGHTRRCCGNLCESLCNLSLATQKRLGKGRARHATAGFLYKRTCPSYGLDASHCRHRSIQNIFPDGGIYITP
jgi:hypothetical protein